MVSFCARCLLLLRWLSSPAVHQVRVLRFAQKNETVNCVMLTLAASLDIAVSPPPPPPPPPLSMLPAERLDGSDVHVVYADHSGDRVCGFRLQRGERVRVPL